MLYKKKKKARQSRPVSYLPPPTQIKLKTPKHSAANGRRITRALSAKDAQTFKHLKVPLQVTLWLWFVPKNSFTAGIQIFFHQARFTDSSKQKSTSKLTTLENLRQLLMFSDLQFKGGRENLVFVSLRLLLLTAKIMANNCWCEEEKKSLNIRVDRCQYAHFVHIWRRHSQIQF